MRGLTGMDSKSRMEALATVLAHLFCREPMPPARAAAMRRAAAGRSSSIVLLPPLPGSCADVVCDYNTKVRGGGQFPACSDQLCCAPLSLR